MRGWPIWYAGAALASACAVALVRFYALARGVIDVPTARSSHVSPTPRGGGLGMMLVFFVAVTWLAARGRLSSTFAATLVASSGLVLLVGFLDDHGHVQRRWRLLAHVAAAGTVAWMGGWSASNSLTMGLLLWSVAAVYVVWLVNLYNFMDGIDGLAAIEAITVGVCGTLVWMWAAPGHPEAMLPALVAAVALGFLVWNWPPARIFMGDAGSGSLGLLFGALSLHATRDTAALWWAWLILLGVFIVDAMVTLIRRTLNGEKPYEAHRVHAYQHASRRFRSHRRVTVAVGIINVCWLFPLAALTATGYARGVLALLLAYAPLVVLALFYRAGGPEEVPESLFVAGRG